MNKILKIIICAMMSLNLVACGFHEEKQDITITLAAAASLQYVFDEKLIPAFEQEYPNIHIEATYDSSGKLQQQIEGGLDADIFFSAATKQMNALMDEGYIDKKDSTELLQNEVVLIVPANSKLDIHSYRDILKADKIAIGDPDSVPAGQYAKEIFETFNMYNKVLDKSSLGTNVTEVLNWVAEGSAMAGVVYASDAASTDKVKVVSSAQKERIIKPAMYPVAMLKKSKHPQETQKFYQFLQTQESLEFFKQYGFTSAK